MFGDILMWVLTIFGLLPMVKGWFKPKKDFQQHLAELNDDEAIRDPFRSKIHADL